jgi:hypothetical protein
MSKLSRERSRNTAAYLKQIGQERLTGMCPWGCGREIRNGGDPLLIHLNVCKGRPRRDARIHKISRRSSTRSLLLLQAETKEG